MAPLPKPLKSLAQERVGVAFVSDTPPRGAVQPSAVEAKAAPPLMTKNAFVGDVALASDKTPKLLAPTGEAKQGEATKTAESKAAESKRANETSGVVFVTDGRSAVASAAAQRPDAARPGRPALMAIANRSATTPPAELSAAAKRATPRVVADAKPTKRAVELLSKAAGDAAKAVAEADFTHLVQQCRHVLAIDQSKVVVDYANQLGSWAMNKRGELRADAAQTQDAIADFREALRMDGDRWRARHNLGVLHAQAGRYSEAFSEFNQVIRENPEFAKAYSNRASLYVQAGDFSLALEDYRQAIALDPDLAVAHKGRGRVCHMLGFMDEALQHFDAAVLLAPDDAHIAACRADLLVDNARYGQAIAGYRQAIALDKQLASAYRNLAWLHATCPEERFRNGGAAVKLASQALEMHGGDDPVSLDTLAAAHAAAGDFDTAVTIIRKAIAGAAGPDAAAYAQRLRLYERGEAFLSRPVAAVQQATYEK